MRKRTLLTGMALVVALVAILAVAAVASAQGPVGGIGTGTPMGQGYRLQDANSDGVCDNFVDEDGDGVCDLMGTRGRGFLDEDGDGVCDNFVDEDGDGVCDLMGTGRAANGSGYNRRGHGMMGFQGTARCGGIGYLDEDGNGVCDNFVDEDGDGVCDLMTGHPAGMGGRFGGHMGGRWFAPQATPGK